MLQTKGLKLTKKQLRVLVVERFCFLLVLNFETKVPVSREAGVLAKHYGVSPLELVSSGALLLCASPPNAPALVRGLKEAGKPQKGKDGGNI
jgi:hydrogenase maturation factor